jgi:hypothetical protein
MVGSDNPIYTSTKSRLDVFTVVAILREPRTSLKKSSVSRAVFSHEKNLARFAAFSRIAKLSLSSVAMVIILDAKSSKSSGLKYRAAMPVTSATTLRFEAATAQPQAIDSTKIMEKVSSTDGNKKALQLA